MCPPAIVRTMSGCLLPKLKSILCIFAAIVTFATGWQIGSCVLANVELRDDMQDIASNLGSNIGLIAPNSDDDFRRDVIRRASQHDIDLIPEQITVERTGSGHEEKIYLAADYRGKIHLLGLTFTLHFNPESGIKPAN